MKEELIDFFRFPYSDAQAVHRLEQADKDALLLQRIADFSSGLAKRRFDIDQQKVGVGWINDQSVKRVQFIR
jgi:hypothetical protein